MKFKHIYIITTLCISGSLSCFFGAEDKTSASPPLLSVSLQESKITTFEEFLKSRGANFSGDHGRYSIFDCKLYDEQNKKYERLNALRSMKEEIYRKEIDFSVTHTPYMQAVAIIGDGGSYTHAITYEIRDCVGIVVQQVKEERVKKSLLSHVNSASNLGSFFAIVEKFLDGIDQVEIKVHFFTSNNTEHLLKVYNYFSDKKISDANMTLTGNKPGVRIIFSTEGGIIARYFPGELFVECGQDESTDRYADPKIVLIDEKGDIYQEVTTFPEEDVYYTCDEEKIYRALGSAGPHIKLGLNVYKNGNHDYLLIPGNPRDCEALLESRQSVYKAPPRSLL
ncbi:MAG: hypothetical protein NT128_05240 [Proteobacteria bacterium]|nr:hypothetical protein [Pseudomonadota bacterium]